ncbi:hypothetical protein [Streptomyces iconiensis]|uniref:Tat pathway signal sequence domain protein n=1 Tax=Streptomyces iconiensis TaxID=1384038 RepID=A0ABT7A4F4_9ACTN|nr:hypothetical protein [Streptomyces iconiensis]MDJ1135716.1 hypothetical protein [Streptomyces iconiensis]
MTTPTGFKKQLAAELSAMATTLSPAPAAPVPARRRRTPFALAAVAAAAAAVVVPAMSGSGGSPAYAVDKQDDGSLILDLNRAEGLPGLQEQLKKLGVPAVALKADKGCTEVSPAEYWATKFESLSSDPGKARIRTDMIPDNATLLVVAEFKDDDSVKAMSYRLVKKDKAPTCAVPGIGKGALDPSVRVG